jgi:hypothetical protein
MRTRFCETIYLGAGFAKPRLFSAGRKGLGGNARGFWNSFFIIKKKDELAGFDSLVRNRHFPKKEEVISELQNSGFENAKVEHDVFPKLSIRNRKEEFVSADRLKVLEEKGFLEESDEVELEKIAEEKIEKLRSFIKENLSKEEKLLMDYFETESDTILTASKAIFKATKPE